MCRLLYRSLIYSPQLYEVLTEIVMFPESSRKHAYSFLEDPRREGGQNRDDP